MFVSQARVIFSFASERMDFSVLLTSETRFAGKIRYSVQNCRFRPQFFVRIAFTPSLSFISLHNIAFLHIMSICGHDALD